MNNEKKQELIEKVIKHWQEMIEWAEKQSPDKSVSRVCMEAEINQSYGWRHCDFCRKFFNTDSSNTCKDCPLYTKYGQCAMGNNKNLWWNVDTSKTWGEWLVNARLFLKQLESLRD